jgi:tetratricopeptide (TPR) repeat protein
LKSFIVFLSCLIGLCAGTQAPQSGSDKVEGPASFSGIEKQSEEYPGASSFAGNYLSSQFAQRHHDWHQADSFMKNVLDLRPDDTVLMNKAMVLAMGSGQPEKAISLARAIVEKEGVNPLPLMFLAVDSFHNKKYAEASEYIQKMPEGSLSEFIMPLLGSWAGAAEGQYRAEGLNKNTIHLYHAILIADFLGRKDQIEALVQKAMDVREISLQDLERLADVYAYIGKKETAVSLYEKISKEWPENRPLAKKASLVRTDGAGNFFRPVRSPEDGVAQALYEMARLLFQEYSDDSARVFAHMALYLNSDLSDARLLLGYITARNERYEDAIAYYQTISRGNEKYAEARRMAADMLEDGGHIEEALAELQSLVDTDKDLEAMIQIGDIYRRHEDFGKAVDAYERAASHLGEKIPPEYWQLHYVRGMSYERLGDWKKAEADLQTALRYQPDQPLVLNYLGYAWADQGINLDRSLELIRKASSLQPEDGFITDSLGWVLYRMGKHAEAVPHLEKAVELLPYDPVINDHLGDAYWQVGRKIEARFQWTRAKNHSTDEKLISQIKDKLDHGIRSGSAVKEASARTGEEEILKP